MRKGGLAVIALDNGMGALFADLDLAIEAKGLLRGAPNQVIHYLLRQTATIVNRVAIETAPLGENAPVESLQRTGE